MSITIFEIFILFILFCFAWITTNLINQMITASFQKKLQRQKIDEAYAQITRLIVRGIATIKANERNEK